jgi:hypothetical protein
MVMTMLATLLLLVVVILVNRVRRVASCKVVCSVPAFGGLMRCELRRRTLLDAGAPGTYPTPREERLRVWFIGAVPVHVTGLSIGLPMWFDARIDKVEATEFDGYFRPEFRAVLPLTGSRH